MEHIGEEDRNKEWEESIKECTGKGFRDFLGTAEDRERWNCILSTSSAVPRRKSRFRDWDEMR